MTKISPVFAILFSILLIAGVEFYQIAFRGNPVREVTRAEEILTTSARELQENLLQLAAKQSEAEVLEFFRQHESSSLGFSYYLIQNSRIVLWSDNEPVFTGAEALHAGTQGILQLANGTFYSYSIRAGSRTVAGLMLIRHNYTYENRYLKNGFNPCLGLGDFQVSDGSDGIGFHAPDHREIFRLKYAPPSLFQKFDAGSWLYLLAWLLLLYGCIALGYSLIRKNRLMAGIILLLPPAIRLAMLFWKFPCDLYNTELFSPRNYASSFLFNSLGDLLLNAVLFISYGLLFYTAARPVIRKGKTMVLPAAILVLGTGLHFLIRGLVINSRIDFNVGNISGLGIYTFIVFLCIGLILIAIFLTLSSLNKIFSGRQLRFRSAVIFLLVTAFYFTGEIWLLTKAREHENRKLLAQKADSRQDHVAEYLFEEAEKKIERDPVLAKAITGDSAAAASLQVRISSEYFQGYLAKFETETELFNALEQPFHSNQDTTGLESYYYLARTSGKEAGTAHLYYLTNAGGRLSYLAILPIDLSDTGHSGTLVLKMNAKFFQSEKGFPELFISGSGREPGGMEDYSFARYSHGSLVYEFGSYAYAFTPRDFENGNRGEDYSFTDFEGYSHLSYHPDADTLIVVSKPKDNTFYILTLFSWIFAFFCILSGLLYLPYRLIRYGRFQFNLTQRIQSSVILLVVLSFLLTGTGTVIYIFSKYSSDQRKSISGQVNGLWFLIGNTVGFQKPLSEASPSQMNAVLNRLVNNLNIDFNLFDEQGRLFYSSQPKIFEQNIVSGRMNPEAFYEIRSGGRTQYIHPEKAGMLHYISAYAPFTDSRGNITGYMNLPYFEKQNELNHEISGFLSALMNIYVLLLALTVFVTLIISGRITKPLLLIQERMGRIRLGKRNEKINYKRSDEIGQLVREYNRMVDELSDSASRLAQSERESAWREMARHVAHESKNPLTPMKLSVQHLQRVYDENPGEREEMIRRFSRTLIDQIDTLSGIASEFSNFAQMPPAKKENMDLGEALQSTVDLFRKTPGIEIGLEIPGQSGKIFADKDYVVRIFSNLLRNAIQAIPGTRKGAIYVSMTGNDDDGWTVSIRDNGTGIPEDQRDKIFRPNFTTKSGGMGLGLALVRNMVENSQGKIWYQTTPGEGTTFFLHFPSLHEMK
ncbi:MAG: HAMP domain-containing histidine kinase [Bacteroidia bacterium]|nr:HAMP domain-containing histidine kinase [Bacteroidia bacterium]